LLLFFVLIVALFALGLPWSARNRHKVQRIIVKSKVALNRWQGREPSLVSIVGDTGLPGARVQVLDSRSGWATLCDGEGKFLLPDVLCYPGATYDLVVSPDENTGYIVRAYAPSSPPSGLIDAGRIILNADTEVSLTNLPGLASITYQSFDSENRDYYRRVFDELSARKSSDEEKVDAVNTYIAAKLNYDESQWELGSPRRILERGSQYCGHLSMAMATILAVAYPVRIIDLRDGAIPPNTHVAVEVFYEGDWHLYDPTYGVKFKNKEGRIISYREIKLNPALISPDLFSAFRQRYPKISLDSLANVYTSGHHHFYYLSYRCSQYAHAWWAYKNRLNYVPAGGRILLAAAGIRAGSNVRYHIRKPSSDDDELTFISHRGGNSVCVLEEEQSPQINLAPGLYDVFVDLYDGNDQSPNDSSPALITGWHLSVKLEVR
jgi:hypothetical protein